MPRPTRGASALFFPMLPEFVIAYLARSTRIMRLCAQLAAAAGRMKWILTDASAGSIVAPPSLAEKVAPLGLPVISYAIYSAPNWPPTHRAQHQIPLATLLYTSGTTGSPGRDADA